jgi:tetratricopeptide (TPR) repeat protein
LDGLVEGLPRDVRDALVDRAEGNPLFAIETVRAMHDQGLTVGGPTRRVGAVRLATGVDAERLNALAAPASLQVLVASRLDLLPARERSVLAAASVIGQTFARGALEAVGELSEDELSAALRELLGRDLLTTVTDRLSSEEGQYAFVQTVVRTVAYQTQAKRDRLYRHLAVVDYLEASADSDGGLSSVIAQHLRDAIAVAGTDDSQRPLLAARLGSWLQRSAARALSVGAPVEAMRAYLEALELAVDAADELRLHLAAAEAAHLAGDQAVCVEHALPIATGEVPASPTEVASAAYLAVAAFRFAGRVDEGWQLLAPWTRDGTLDPLPAGVAAKLARQVSVYLNDRAELDEALAWTERALRLAEDAGDVREIAHGLNGMALSYMFRGLPRVGSAALELAAQYAREHGLLFELGRTLINQLAFGLNRDLDAALQAGHEAATVTEQTGNPGLLWHTAINQAAALVLAGRWDDVDTLLDRPLLRERPPEPYQESLLVVTLGLIALVRDEPVDLDALERNALQAEGEESISWLFAFVDRALLARATGDMDLLVPTCHRVVELANKYVPLEDDYPMVWTLAVDWMMDARDFAGARELLRPVADVPATRLSPILAAQLPRLRGAIEALDAASTADPAVVEKDLLDGIRLLDEFGAMPYRARAQATLGVWLTQQGRPADAAPYLAAARESFTELRASLWLRDLDAALSLAATG